MAGLFAATILGKEYDSRRMRETAHEVTHAQNVLAVEENPLHYLTPAAW